MQTNSIDDKQLDFHFKGQLMKRIIRSNAVKTSNEAKDSLFTGYLRQKDVSKVVDIYGGTIFASFVSTHSPSASVSEDVSESLQTILRQQPSMVPYLVLLSSIAFLVMTLIWGINARIEEVSELPYYWAPPTRKTFRSTEKALKTAQKTTDVAKIPVQRNDLTLFVGQTLKQTLEPTVPQAPLVLMRSYLKQYPDLSLLNLREKVEIRLDEGSENDGILSGKVLAIFPSKTNKPINFQTEFKIIPKKHNLTEVQFQTNHSQKVRVVHAYRVADMFKEK